MAEIHPSHDWWEIDEETRIAKFCNKCDICQCHSGDLAGEPCPGEPSGPDDSESQAEATQGSSAVDGEL